MVAYKCDRCGKYYDHKGKVTISEVVEGADFKIYSAEDYQLCPSCEKDLLSWLHNENVEETLTYYADGQPVFSCSKEHAFELVNKED